ncbi:GWxTD domain-containing protein [bacterium]|nr:GWxTD domain-containing protein [bacterium]
MKKCLTAVAIFSGFITGSGAQPFLSHVDQAVFRYEGQEIYWEIYYTLQGEALAYQSREAGGFQCDLLFSLNLFRQGGPQSTRAWRYQQAVEDTAFLARDLEFIDRIRLAVEPGDYRAVLIAEDRLRPGRLDSLLFEARIDAVPQDRVFLSGIELAYKIETNFPDRENPFYKNSLKVIPNPGARYNTDHLYLYYYAELYNLTRLPDGSAYALTVSVVDSTGNPVESVPPAVKNRTVAGESSVEWGALRVGFLPEGEYSLALQVRDEGGALLATGQKHFRIKSEQQQPQPEIKTHVSYYASEFSGMSLEELDQDFAMAAYIARDVDKKEWERVGDLEKKRRWLFDFWKARDTDPSTNVNEYRMDYLERIRHANEHFAAFGKEGWKTDRGRVYIQYGAPDYIMPYPNEPDMKPYETWSYDSIQGGVVFIFADMNMNKDYRLLHSNLRGELSNTHWESMITRGHY